MKDTQMTLAEEGAMYIDRLKQEVQGYLASRGISLRDLRDYIPLELTWDLARQPVAQEARVPDVVVWEAVHSLIRENKQHRRRTQTTHSRKEIAYERNPNSSVVSQARPRR